VVVDEKSLSPGNIIGTVLDQLGEVSVAHVIRLTPEDKSAYRKVISGDNGQFSSRTFLLATSNSR